MPDIPAQLAAALADRYTIERELGRGGNATVYLAHDRKHKRKVALKVLLPELAQSVRTERFLHEIEIAAGLTHPHILPVHDSGEAQGFLYYVMPYVAGESLRARLTREQHLPVEEALRIARDVAEALGYAHSQGVVHRDIKPENILLSEGGAVVADFGIARALTEAGGPSVTATGIAVGTPVYMSPEQGAGSRTLDGRSDIYGLGCVVYEMLAGQPPYTGETAQEVLAHHALDPVPALRKVRPDVPAGVDLAIQQALAKKPAERFATAAEFASALAAPGASARLRVRMRRLRTRRLGMAFATAVVLTSAAIALRRSLVSAPSEQSVAVLPFVNMSGDSAAEYFSDGVTETLTNGLVQVQGLRVPARTSAFAFKGKNTDIHEIGRQLQVANVVEGSVQRAGNRLRVTAQLIKVGDGYHLWSQTYDRDIKDVFAVQDEIAHNIVKALEVKLARPETTALVQPQTRNLEAYDLYLKGRYAYNRRTPASTRQAIRYFEAAIIADSSYAVAYSGLADAYLMAGLWRFIPLAEAWPKAKRAALEAVALDAGLAEAHTSLGYAWQVLDWNWVGAENEYRRAIALNPRYAQAHSWYGTLLGLLGRRDEAIREESLGQQLDSLFPALSFILGSSLYQFGRYEPAERELRRAIRLQADYAGAHWVLGSLFAREGRFDSAFKEVGLANQLQPGSGRFLGTLGALYSQTGNRKQALAVLDQLRSTPVRDRIAEARICLAIGDTGQALALLEKWAAQRVRSPFSLVDVQFESLRSHPRYVALLARYGLTP